MNTKDKNGKFTKTYGLCGHPTYRSWHCMLQRCTNPNSTYYQSYGERGIGVCEEWRDFKTFVADMGLRPQGTFLDRINNNVGYYKENCRWATPKEQAQNRRERRMVQYAGREYSVTELCELLGINRQRFYNHLNAGKTTTETIIFLNKSANEQVS